MSIRFAFENEPQDYKPFLEGPWRDHYTDPWDDFVERMTGPVTSRPRPCMPSKHYGQRMTDRWLSASGAFVRSFRETVSEVQVHD